MSFSPYVPSFRQLEFIRIDDATNTLLVKATHVYLILYHMISEVVVPNLLDAKWCVTFFFNVSDSPRPVAYMDPTDVEFERLTGAEDA